MIDRKICIAAVAAGIVLIAALGCVIFTITSAHSGTMTLSESLDEATDNQGRIRMTGGTYIDLNTWQKSGMNWSRTTAEYDGNSVVLRTYVSSTTKMPNDDGTMKDVKYYPPTSVSSVTWTKKGVTYTWF